MLYKIIVVQGDLAKKNTSISYIHLEENAGVWNATTIHFKKNDIGFSSTINTILQMPITTFNTIDVEVSQKLAAEVMHFMQENALEHKVDFIALEGLKINEHLYFGDGATFAATIQFPIIGEFYKINMVLQGNNNIYAIANDLLQLDAIASDENKNISIGLLAALRWRESNNILQKNTNATKDHIAGSIWLGVEA
jgi:hypothetical protein